MADFQLEGEIKIDQSGLAQFEQAAIKSGDKAGDALNQGLQKGSKDAGKVLSDALKQGASAAGEAGKKAGEELSSGVAAGAKSIPDAVKKEFKKAEKEGEASGEKTGKGFADGVKSATSKAIPDAIKAAAKKAEGEGKSSGDKLGKNTVEGFKKGLAGLPKSVQDELKKAGGKGKAEGTQSGENFADGMKVGVVGTGEIVASTLFKGWKQQATTEGTKSGDAAAEGFKQGFNSEQYLFKAMIDQATKAAKDVDLIFDKTELNFKYPDGGIVPREELDKIVSLNDAMGQATATVAQFVGPVNQAKKAAESAGDGVQKLKTQSTLLDGVVAGLTATLSGALLGALGRLKTELVGVVTGFAELDQQIRLANSATGEGQSGYDTLKAAIDRVGIEAAATQGEIAALALELTRAGLTAEETAQVMPSVSRAAEGTGTAFANMASVVGQSLNVFGIPVEEAARVTDILVEAANSSSTSVDGLGEALRYAAPAANSLGVSMEDTVAAVGLLANAGIDASNAGTGLRTVLTRLSLAAAGASGESLGLTRGQEKLGDAMKILGAQVTDTEGNLKPLDQTFKALKESMDQLSKAEQVELATALFGEQGATKFLGVINQTDTAINDMFGTIRSSKGATDEARKNMEGLQTSFDQLSGSIDVAKSTFGDVIGSAIRPFVDALANIIDVFNRMPGPIKKTLAALGILATSIGVAKVATLAWSAALKNVAFQEFAKGVGNLANQIKGSLVADLKLAATGVKNFGKALSKVNAKAAAAALINLSKALVQGKWNTVAGQASTFAKSLGLVDKAGDLDALKRGAANLVGLDRQLKYVTDSSGKTKKSIELVAKEGSKIGTFAAKAAPKLGTFGKATGVAGGKIAALALACPPLTAAIAALGVGIVSYNSVMGESRKVTETLQPSIDALGDAANKAGIEFDDLGKQGGPLAEAWRNMGSAIDDFGDKLGEIPVVGNLAKGAWEGFIKVLGYTPIGIAIKGIQKLVGWVKNLYAEASRNQAIIESADQLAQFNEITGKTEQSAMKLVAELERLGSTATPEELARIGAEGAEVATQLTASINTAKQLAGKFRELAAAATAAGDTELAAKYEMFATNADKAAIASAKYRDKLLDSVGATKQGELALEAYSGKVDDATKKLIELGAKAQSLDLQIQGGEKGLQLVQAQNQLVDQRFTSMKSYYAYELTQLDGIYGKEAEREKLEKRIVGIERAAWEQKKAALDRELEIERQLLLLNQQKAQIEANVQVVDAKLAAKEKEADLQEAINEGDQDSIDIARSAYALAQSNVTLAGQRSQALGGIQDIERQILQTTGDIKKEALKGEGALKGWVQPTKDTWTQINAIANTANKLKPAWDRAKQATNGVQIVTKRLADGTILIVSETKKIATGMKGVATETNRVKTAALESHGIFARIDNPTSSIADSLGKASTDAGTLATSADSVNTSIGGTDASQLSADIKGAADASGELAENTDDAKTSIDNLPDLTGTSDDLGSIAGDVEKIADADAASTLDSMDGAASNIASSMSTAATNAESFYSAMEKAAGIPCNKWMGGDVKAGQKYTVNEIGQEAFRSRSGRLSLIQKPAFGMWRPPSDGVVLPAGITARLKDEGAFDRAPGRARAQESGSDQASLVPVIGKLQRSVDDLVAKDWNVQVRVRNSEGSSALSVLNKMRT